jgi:hypothetical protein
MSRSRSGVVNSTYPNFETLAAGSRVVPDRGAAPESVADCPLVGGVMVVLLE